MYAHCVGCGLLSIETAASAVTCGGTTLAILYGLPSDDGQSYDMCAGHRLAVQIDDMIDNVVPAGIIRHQYQPDQPGIIPAIINADTRGGPLFIIALPQ